jgi:dephospho-CoA kinase
MESLVDKELEQERAKNLQLRVSALEAAREWQRSDHELLMKYARTILENDVKINSLEIKVTNLEKQVEDLVSLIEHISSPDTELKVIKPIREDD